MKNYCHQIGSHTRMGLRLAYFHFFMTHSEVDGQGHAHFVNEYLRYGDRYGKLTCAIYEKSSMVFRLAYLHLTLTISKGYVQRHAQLDN